MNHVITPIIGMSPGNSYFKDKEVIYILSNIVEIYGHATIFIADIPAISTYLALGYPLNKATDKALSKGRNLKNRTNKCRQLLGIAEEKIHIIDWATNVQNSPSYLEAYSQVLQLYNTNKKFQQEVNNTTLKVLLHAGKPLQDLNASVTTGSHYLLSELAFLDIASQFLQSEKIIYIYHKPWPIYTNYIAGHFDGKKKKTKIFSSCLL